MLPSWDLLISALFVAVIAFSFILGKDVTQKLIIATYISILAVDGLSYFIYRMFLAPNATVNILNVTAATTTQVTMKLFLFVISLVVLTARGSFTATFLGNTRGILGLFVQAALGFLLAALVTSTILVFLSGACFMPGIQCAPSNLAEFIKAGSDFAYILLTKAYVWFMLPALALVVSSAISGEGD